MLQLLRSFLFACSSFGLLCAGCAVGQTISALTPSSVSAGSGGFVLTVTGSGFNSSSIVRLHTTNGVLTLQTYFVNSNLLMARVYALNVENPGSLQVDVANYSTQSSSSLATLTVTEQVPAPAPDQALVPALARALVLAPVR